MNQDGYMEEALKLPCALQEFRRAPDGGEPPSIVGFREHIFSTIGAMGDFAGGAELAFGTLVQRTMAYPLWSRLHYGHPDMLDKLALIGQGGMSKGDKHINLSEDIFAGMDATLRGRHITYCDYFQVGKGRDMGVDSVLGFFMKLAAGTAKMTTSRQAYRMAERTSLSRNLSFYYAHIGMYIGSLHEYHVAYLMLALAFVGCVADATGVLPGAAPPSLALINEVYVWMSLIFVSFHILPLFLALLREEGIAAAIRKPIQQLCQLSWVYFNLQSRMVGHCFAREFSEGGGGYVATGRGLSIDHIPFHKLYTLMAVPTYYPAAEMVLFLLTIFCLPGQDASALSGSLSPFGVVFACVYPASLLFGPTWFNPHAFADANALGRQWFRCSQVCRDFKLWLRWLNSTLTAGCPAAKLDQLHRPLAFTAADVGSTVVISEGGKKVKVNKLPRKVNWGVQLADLWADASPSDVQAATDKKYTRPDKDNPKYAAHKDLEGEIEGVQPWFKGEIAVKTRGGAREFFEHPWSGELGKLDVYQENNSWREFHAKKQENKGNVELHSFLLPSKELLLSLPLLLIAYKSMVSNHELLS
jgi:hypothetical protein